jgi:hypothetical protein
VLASTSVSTTKKKKNRNSYRVNPSKWTQFPLIVCSTTLKPQRPMGVSDLDSAIRDTCITYSSLVSLTHP